jgi:hypothetical protein
LFWNCIDNAFVFCFGIVSTMLLLIVLELYRQCFCFLCWNCIDNVFVFCFGIVSTMLLFIVLELYRQCFCLLFWNCIDNAFDFCFSFYCKTQLFLFTILTKSSAVIVLIDSNLDFKSCSDIVPSSICLAYT